jgi:hypothetical protein
MTVNGVKLHEMTTAYLECALWSSTDESNEQGGDPLDSNYSFDDIDIEELVEAEATCQQFLDKYAYIIGERYQQAGHDLWLTRNHHGCGFWEVPDWPKEDGEILTQAAQALGEVSFYVGDDNKLYTE